MTVKLDKETKRELGQPLLLDIERQEPSLEEEDPFKKSNVTSTA